MKYRIHPAAGRELDEAAAWYETHEPGLGAVFLEACAAKFAQAAAHPERGAPCAWIGGRITVRKFDLRRFPYTIFVAVPRDEVLVVAVAHQRRRPGYWTRRLRAGHGPNG